VDPQHREEHLTLWVVLGAFFLWCSLVVWLMAALPSGSR